MSDSIIIGYDDHDTAKRSYAQVIELQRDHIAELTGLAVVTVEGEGQSVALRGDEPAQPDAAPAPVAQPET